MEAEAKAATRRPRPSCSYRNPELSELQAILERAGIPYTVNRGDQRSLHESPMQVH
ncbi:hypothetical protein Gohar_001593 [Gossypium harknessii]|uniref:Uncharacterized protein n=1 Tax=Gossypium harknessii TaxID=34285 RepID=A0A7J9I4H0_9ROSI|nr:hypothetical protein [Gossypium harknessii]